MGKGKYVFSGDVLKFGTVIYRGWKVETYAISLDRAISNFKYRFRQKYNISSSTPLSLIGVFEKV